MRCVQNVCNKTFFISHPKYHFCVFFYILDIRVEMFFRQLQKSSYWYLESWRFFSLVLSLGIFSTVFIFYIVLKVGCRLIYAAPKNPEESTLSTIVTYKNMTIYQANKHILDTNTESKHRFYLIL